MQLIKCRARAQLYLENKVPKNPRSIYITLCDVSFLCGT